jgi:hypothetical protein
MVDLGAAMLIAGRYFDMYGSTVEPPWLRVDESGALALASHSFGCEAWDWPLVLGETVEKFDAFGGAYARRLDAAVVDPGFIELSYTVAGTPHDFGDGDTEPYLFRLRQVTPDRAILTFGDPALPEEVQLYRLDFEASGEETGGF